MKFTNKLLLEWGSVSTLAVFAQAYNPETNPGILIAIIMIPIFVHDIIQEYSQKGRTKK
jgi:hypothetical protein